MITDTDTDRPDTTGRLSLYNEDSQTGYSGSAIKTAG